MWSDKTDDPHGGCAFPFVDRLDERTSRIEKGMTLRDYFASTALVGLLHAGGGSDYGVAAEMAYELADAMLKERQKAMATE